MSTAQKELEELRKIREAERLKAEHDAVIEEEKSAQKAKKNAFLSRAAMFEQKKGPTDEEIKQQITKESSKRRFGRELNKQLSSQPGKNAMAVELKLKNKYDGVDESEFQACDDEDDNGSSRGWEYVPQQGAPSYYWNRLTNETRYELPPELQKGLAAPPPPPPPPPPPRRLSIVQPPPPPPPPKSSEEVPPAPAEPVGWTPLATPDVGATQAPPPPPPPPPSNKGASTGRRVSVQGGKRGSVVGRRVSTANALDLAQAAAAAAEAAENSTTTTSAATAAATASTSSTVEGITYSSENINHPWQYVWEGEEYPYYWNIETNETTFDQPANFVHEEYSDGSSSSGSGSGASNYTITIWHEQQQDSGEYLYTSLTDGQTRTDTPEGVRGVTFYDDSSGQYTETWYEYIQEESTAAMAEGLKPGDYFYYNSDTGALRLDKPAGGYEVITETIYH